MKKSLIFIIILLIISFVASYLFFNTSVFSELNIRTPLFSIMAGGDELNQDELSLELDIGNLLYTPSPWYESIPTYFRGSCADFDTEYFNSAGCAASCGASAHEVKFSDGSKFSDCSVSEVCCVSNDLYAGYDCLDNPLDKDASCQPTPYWNSYYEYAEDYCNCYGENSPDVGDKHCNDANMDVPIVDSVCNLKDCYDDALRNVNCLQTDFFCNRYSNVFCSDGSCNNQNVNTCLADSDCWSPACGVNDESCKQGVCGAKSCMGLVDIADCVERSNGIACIGSQTFDGNQWQFGFMNEIRNSDKIGRLGCENLDDSTNGKYYDCCLIHPDNDVNRDYEAWELAYKYDYTVCDKNSAVLLNSYYSSPGIVKGQQVSCIWPESKFVSVSDLPCAGTPCGNKIVSGIGLTLDDYRRCWECGDMCDVGECCNNVDDDGDGSVDKNDSGCNYLTSPREGGVCFA